MFDKLFDLQFQRTPKQAFGFYIGYLVLIMLSGGIVAGVFGLVSGGGFQAGLKIGQLIAIITILFISFMLLKCKNMFSFTNVLLALLAGVLAVLGGGLLGLIPVSYLTTKSCIEKSN